MLDVWRLLRHGNVHIMLEAVVMMVVMDSWHFLNECNELRQLRNIGAYVFKLVDVIAKRLISRSSRLLLGER